MLIRNIKKEDNQRVDELALKAFEQYSDYYHPWEEFRNKITHMSQIDIEIIIAEEEGLILGAVGFVAPHSITNSHFPTDWAAIRMLVVDPKFRGKGIGRKLTEACIQRAKKLGCQSIGLHTSPIMKVALPLYLRMGFAKFTDIDDIYGVKYATYRLNLT